MKRVVSVLLVLAIVFSLMAGMVLSSNASTNGHSQAAALAWLNGTIGHQIGDGQCPALAREYYAYLGYSVSGDGKDYEYNIPNGSGWIRTYYYSGFIPEPGDIAVWRKTKTDAGSIYGHVAIVKSATSSGMVCYEQGNSAGNKVRTNTYNSYGSVTCFIHPDFAPDTPSEKPSVYANNDKFAIGSNVTFSFYAPNADSVYLGLYLNGQMYFNGEFAPGATYTRTLTQTGHYAFYIVAHYPGGDTESDWRDFDVFENLSAFVPQKPVVWTDADRFAIGTDITVYHWSELAKYYSVSVYRNNVFLKNEYVYTGTSVINYATPGTYEIVVGAINDYGESEYGATSFTIYDFVPGKPDLWVEGETFETDTNISIHHWANLARRYTISIYKDDNLIKNEDNYAGIYTANFSNPGEYKIVAVALNEFGESEYAQITLNVICKQETQYQHFNYTIPSLTDIYTTVTIKSNENEYSVTAANGVFALESIKADVYKVYAKQKNSLTICIGEYDTKSGEVTNTSDVFLPLGDVNGDEVIDIADISVLLATGNFGQANADIDLTGDGLIKIDDIAEVLQTKNFGKSSVAIV